MTFSHIKIHNGVRIINENSGMDYLPQYAIESLASVYEKYFFQLIKQ